MMRGMLGNLILLSFLCGGAIFFCPPGGGKKILTLLCTAVLSLAILRPLLAFDMEAYALREAEVKSTEREILQNGKAGEDLLQRLALQERCERYIEQKAAAFGFSPLDAAVELQRGEEGIWLPFAATMRTDRAGEAAMMLQSLIRSDLGIPEERQVWLERD